MGKSKWKMVKLMIAYKLAFSSAYVKLLALTLNTDLGHVKESQMISSSCERYTVK